MSSERVFPSSALPSAPSFSLSLLASCVLAIAEYHFGSYARDSGRVTPTPCTTVFIVCKLASWMSIVSRLRNLRWQLQKVTHLQNPLLREVVRLFLRTHWILPFVWNGKRRQNYVSCQPLTFMTFNSQLCTVMILVQCHMYPIRSLPVMLTGDNHLHVISS